MNRRIGYVLSLLAIGLLAFGLWNLRDRNLDDPAPAPGAEETAFPARLNAVEAAIRSEEPGRAAQLIEDLRGESPEIQPERLFQIGLKLAENGWFTPAEWCFEQAVRLAPREHAYRLRLAMLQYLTGRYERAHEEWVYLLRHGGLDLISMPALGNREIRWSYEDEALDRGAAAGVEDPLLCLALAHRALERKNFTECESLLLRAQRLDSNSLDAQVHWARYLYESGQPEALRHWLAKFNRTADQHADLWVLRGHLCREEVKIPEAIRCFWEAFQRDPLSYTVNDQLAKLLSSLERNEEADRFRARSEDLRKYAEICRLIHLSDTPRERHFRTATDHSKSLGCFREALGWCNATLAYYPDVRWAIDEHRLLSASLNPNADRINPDLDLRNQLDFSNYPLPVLDEPGVTNDSLEPKAMTANIHFQDATESVGIDFVFEDGADPATAETLLFEFTGGGVAVLDYDRDGWPDLFFSQGGPPPIFGQTIPSNERTDPHPSDQLVRNLGTGRFVETTALAGLSDEIYSQGAAVGDFNSDGFPDLYVSNVGVNALYSNNGDGTFQRVDVPAFSDAASWTTSCAMADLNGDSHPDLYDVNYVEPEYIHERMCKSGGASVPCARSKMLRAGQDQLFLNTGDGDFRNVTEDAGIVAEEGIGLGIVVADFDRSGSLDIFVANDARANFLFVNRQTENGPFRFEEQALLAGVAFSGTGLAQACMGVAADDMNGDGLIDLFVTNFYDEYNTLYQQRPGLLFEDKTKVTGIQAVSYKQLGFGSQFLDADLDGDPDLVYTNGDVVDFSPENSVRQYHQQPQFLRNIEGKHFQELPADELGSFFQKRSLGRGLARLDWNRDGREEFAVSHIGEKAALLLNTTGNAGHFLEITLVATHSSRDAIGAIVTVESESNTWTRQVTAGDGYMASNQRHLVFGLGSEVSFQKITVEWPSGRTDEFSGGQPDRSLVIVEGKANPFSLP